MEQAMEAVQGHICLYKTKDDRDAYLRPDHPISDGSSYKLYTKILSTIRH